MTRFAFIAIIGTYIAAALLVSAAPGGEVNAYAGDSIVCH